MTTLKASTGPQFARIMSVGSATPSRVVPNDYFLEFIDSSDEWITQRTGIKERRWIAEDESITTLCLAAARSAIERAGISVDQIDAVILSTISHYHQTPALAPQLATELGIPDAAAFDISAACAGFSYGLAQAESMVRSGQARHVLLIAGETISEITDVTDRGTAFLFGDGAGAAIVGPSETNGIGPVVWGSDGSQAGAIWQTVSWQDAVTGGTWPSLGMDGRAVFKWATSFIAQAAKKCLDEAGITPDELDVFIPHQANDRITDTLLRYLKLPEKVVVARTIRHLGNNSAATIPMAMDALLTSGEAKSGQTALIIGFGAGLVYAGQVITLP
jgi:3-oxoacyl-[acyl-carrier-protein] synthase III